METANELIACSLRNALPVLVIDKRWLTTSYFHSRERIPEVKYFLCTTTNAAEKLYVSYREPASIKANCCIEYNMRQRVNSKTFGQFIHFIMPVVINNGEMDVREK